MRFGIKSERSERPKLPQRVRLRQSTSTYRVPSESEDSSDDEFEEGVVDGGQSDSEMGSEDSFCYASESEVPALTKRHSRPSKTMEEQRELTEAMASIRLHVGYSDPLEEWKKRNKQAAFDAAQARMRRKQADMLSLYLTAAKITEANAEKTLQEQQVIIERTIRAHEQRQYEEDQQNLQRWEARNKMLWEQIDNAAASVEAKLEAQRQREREVERRATEAESQRIQAEKERKDRVAQFEREKREKAEAERRRIQEEKEKAAKEELERKEKEEEERKAAEEKQKQEAAQLSRFDSERKKAGITMPTEDWNAAIATDQGIKTGSLRLVKEDSVQRRQWTAVRRSVTLRVGQLTDSDQEIVRISNQIFDAARTFNPQSDLYPAALSALAKAIILQAETEVTAKLDTATPLASVVINLFNLPGFDEVLWSKMVVRSGGWLIGHCVTKQQIQSLPQIRGQRPDKNLEEKLFKKLCGFREDETQVERQTRIGGIISLYFAICTSPKATRPLPLPFWPTKIWTFLARIMSDPRLLRQSMAPYLMHSCLESAAPKGAAMFGRQWIKLLMAMGQASMEDGKVGASDDAGKTARVRLQLKAEKLLEDLGAFPGR